MLLCYPGTRRDMVEKTRKQLHGGVEKKVIFHEVSVPVSACIKSELNQPLTRVFSAFSMAAARDFGSREDPGDEVGVE